MKRVLLTGANGFIGVHLAQALTARGDRVTALLLEGTSGEALDSCDVVFSRFENPEAIAALAQSQDLILNLAGNLQGACRQRYFNANVLLPELLVQALQKLSSPPPMLHFSTIAAQGPSTAGRGKKEEDLCHPISLYGRSKRAGELAILRHGSHLPITILRLCSLFGPLDQSFLGLFRLAERGIFLRLCTREKLFQLLYIHDFVRLVLRLVDRPPREKILNLGGPDIVSDEVLAKALGAAAGKPLRPIFVPKALARILGRACDFLETITGHPDLMSSGKIAEMSHAFWLQDFSRFLEIYGPLGPFAFTPLTTAVKETFTWYRSQGLLS